MVKIDYNGYEYRDGKIFPSEKGDKSKTIAHGILNAHNTSGNMQELKLRFDAIASHDITYVGIIQTARAAKMTRFPLPYVLTNCHNSLCAVGGTINEDDHLFGLSAVKKYGGEFVPAHAAVIHQYMRERYAGCGKMILASDSHTRYGPAGTLAIGEGGPELAKQLLEKTYDIRYPQVMAVWLEGKPRPGVGPQDVALALVGAVFADGAVKNKVLEFVGPGVENLSMDFRFGIDVMTTETACLSSIWRTDAQTEKYLKTHGRAKDYRCLNPGEGAGYDGCVSIDLSKIEPMIAMPFHPSNAYPIRQFLRNAEDILAACDAEAAKIMNAKEPPASLRDKFRDGKFYVDQAFIGGCSGGIYQNIRAAADILDGHAIGFDNFWLSVYPASAPMLMQLTRDGTITRLMQSGASIRSAFCGPCFGAGDVPANGGLSIRHSTRNFPNREGSKPGDGQIAYVALMDARSIAATARNGGVLTPADELPDAPENTVETGYDYDDTFYRTRVYYGVGDPKPEEKLILGPNITDWPEQVALTDDLLLEVASAIYDPVTTTDELIPSGETSSYRSNPVLLASYTLSRKDPEYVGRAEKIRQLELMRREAAQTGNVPAALADYLGGRDVVKCAIGSAVFALKPGDGSAREQAASCQRVLGGSANIAGDYATKRYRSNLVNWGMLPFVLDDAANSGIKPGDRIYIPGVREALLNGSEALPAVLISDGKEKKITLRLPGIEKEEAEIIAAGCLTNFYAAE